MKIIGDIRPYTNQNYTYTMVTNAGIPVKVNLWQVYNGDKLLTENGKGVFKFGINTAGANLKLLAKVRDPKTDKLVDFHINIQPLAGKPKILDVYWQDVNGVKIQNREVAYLDKVTLVVKTQNIPQGDTLKVTIYEDEYADGHGDSSRNMDTYYTKGISKNGYAYLEFNTMSLYQKTLNNMDSVNEDTHEYYAKIHYYKNKLDHIEDGIQLKVKNKLKQMVQPDTGNKPSLVGEVESVAKDQKKPVNFTFGVFLDGTLNNMYNTELREVAEGKKKNTNRFLSDSDIAKIIDKHGGADTSYENALSNPAILFKNYKEEPKNKMFRIYTEGIGSNTRPNEKGDLRKEDYKGDDISGKAAGMGKSGIKSKVRFAIGDIVAKLTKIDSSKEMIGVITVDVFGFSRGAAAARHFVHVVTASSYIAQKSTTGHVSGTLEDMQGYDLDDQYQNRYMPSFGYLGQLLEEKDLLHDDIKINIRFVGIYDTVPHHGIVQNNDYSDLGLDNVNRAGYVVHMTAADEHRANFSLVDISSVSKTSPSSGHKGGIELVFPGVHCDVGGAYEEGKPDKPLRIDAANTEDELKLLRSELIHQGWFKEKELVIIKDSILKPSYFLNRFRLEGNRAKLSNQYSFIPLHLMANFCIKKSVPIDKEKIIKFQNFKSNWIPNNVDFLESIHQKLYNYALQGGKPLTFENDPQNVSILRNHYLHWNSTYGQEGIDVGVQTNYPNKVNGKRKRKIR